MKQIFSLILISIVLFSCKKDAASIIVPNENAQEQVKLDWKYIDQKVADFKTTHVAVKRNCNIVTTAHIYGSGGIAESGDVYPDSVRVSISSLYNYHALRPVPAIVTMEVKWISPAGPRSKRVAKLINPMAYGDDVGAITLPGIVILYNTPIEVTTYLITVCGVEYNHSVFGFSNPFTTFTGNNLLKSGLAFENVIKSDSFNKKPEIIK